MRKPSVTISATGAPPNIPNGVSIAGKSSAGSQIKFGQIYNADGSPRAMNATPHQPDQSGSSLGVDNSANPRITSPANSPSPIPQPSASGGKPPSHGHSGSVNFGSFNPSGANVSCSESSTLVLYTDRSQMNSGMPSGPLAPGSQHLRRESSHSQHSDMSNHGMGPGGGGRGGYPPQGGRGRGYGGPQPYQQQMSYSPQTNYRPPPPNQSGPRPNIPFQPQQNRSYGSAAYPNSPHQSARSPVPPNAQPVHPQQGPVSMQNPQMGGHPYGYNNQYGAYQNVPPQQVDPKFLHVPWRKNSGPTGASPTGHAGSTTITDGPPTRKNKRKDSIPTEARQPVAIPFDNQNPPFIDLSPRSGHFEQFLTMRQQAYAAMGSGYPNDPSYQYQYAHYFPQGMQSYPMPMPQSPRPQNQMPPGPGQQGPYSGQYGGPQPPAMSRTSSALSGADRPASSMGRPAPASSTPAPPNSVATANRPSQSPAPQANKDWKIPQKKSAGIVIRTPNGDIVDLKKSSASPAPSSKSPAPSSSAAATPPPSSNNESGHARNESKSVKTEEEKRAEMKEEVAKKIAADKAEAQQKVDEAKAAEDKKESEAVKAKEEAEAKQLDAAKKQMEAEEAEKKNKAEAEEAAKAAKEAAAGEDEAAKKAREAEEMEAMIAQWEKEEAEQAAKEEEQERAYAEKKKAEKEEAARKEAERFKMADEEMKKAEREAEEAEETRLKELEDADGEESHKEREEMFASLRKNESSTPTSETPAEKDTPAESGAATPASETSSMAPPKATPGGGKQKPAALKLETTKSVEPPQPTPQLQALRTARKINLINDISYPAPISSPNPALNANAKGNNMRYDRAFLMQFQRAFTEKPSENWSDRLKETVGDTSEPQSARATSARGSGGPSSMGMSGRQPSNRAPMPAMGAFGQGGRTLPPGTTSAGRFEAASRPGATPSRPTMQNPLASFVSNRPGAGFPNPGAVKMERGPSSTGMGGHPNSPRNASRGGSSQRGNRGNQRREDPKDNKAMPLTAGANLEPIKVTSTGWKPQSIHSSMSGPAPGGDGHMAPDVVQRKVKSNLNKMTPNNFDKISGQILAIAHQSKDETDGRSLRQVIQLTFEKATDEAHWAEMYAQFCKRMLESMSPEIKDESILDKKGDIVAGGALFRKYLLTRCQTEFEQGWKINLPEQPEGESKEAALLSDEYYIAAAAKRRGLGLVRFIGELYKLGMLTERIMHECVKKLVDYESTPDEAEVESLTSLLKTIGGQLDGSEKGHQMMDVYFGRISQMVALPDLNSRLKFMLMDTVDLRKSGWQTKGSGVKGPTTLDAVRAQVSNSQYFML